MWISSSSVAWTKVLDQFSDFNGNKKLLSSLDDFLDWERRKNHDSWEQLIHSFIRLANTIAEWSRGQPYSPFQGSVARTVYVVSHLLEWNRICRTLTWYDRKKFAAGAPINSIRGRYMLHWTAICCVQRCLKDVSLNAQKLKHLPFSPLKEICKWGKLQIRRMDTHSEFCFT